MAKFWGSKLSMRWSIHWSWKLRSLRFVGMIGPLCRLFKRRIGLISPFVDVTVKKAKMAKQTIHLIFNTEICFCSSKLYILNACTTNLNRIQRTTATYAIQFRPPYLGAFINKMLYSNKFQSRYLLNISRLNDKFKKPWSNWFNVAYFWFWFYTDKALQT